MTGMGELNSITIHCGQGTRIHPESYTLANKIALDALDDPS
jgi:hypothetical protein